MKIVKSRDFSSKMKAVCERTELQQNVAIACIQRRPRREMPADLAFVEFFFVKRFALCYRTVGCRCPVCNVGVLWPNGCMDQDATWYGDRPRPGPRPHCVDGDPASPRKGAQQ